jgi:hypothetical protein
MNLKIFLSNLFDEKVLYNELYSLEEEIGLEDQSDLLKEDLLQVGSLDETYILDVGWYPEFDIKGHFEIKIIKKYDWENPVFTKRCSDILSLKQILLECKPILGF